jgi:hypothetical protein
MKSIVRLLVLAAACGTGAATSYPKSLVLTSGHPFERVEIAYPTLTPGQSAAAGTARED